MQIEVISAMDLRPAHTPKKRATIGDRHIFLIFFVYTNINISIVEV